MKLITLNAWMGGMREPFLDFIRLKAAETDIFCFQEVLSGGEDQVQKWWPKDPPPREPNLLALLQTTLPQHKSFFHPNIGEWTGLAMFVRDSFGEVEAGDFFVHKSGPVFPGDEGFTQPYPKNIQYATFGPSNNRRTVLNFHGLWNGGSHDDAPERIAQSEKIAGFIRELKNKHVVCGDFNLLPDTESLAIIERETGMRNLIREYGITSTRTRFYTRSADKHADYIFVSPDINVKDFKVLPDEVSDHSPLYLEFE